MIKINKLEIENVKRIKAVSVDFTGNELNIIGGNNGQGKTSVLDAICFALGGEKFKPSNIKREGAMVDPSIKITLSNGLIVERKGKNSTLKVTDPSGTSAGQSLLNKFIEQLALNLPKFLNANNKEKAKILLQTLGIEEQLQEFEQKEKNVYSERHALGQIADRKQKFADELPCFENVPEELITASELIQRQQNMLATNGENQRKKERLNQLKNQAELIESQISELIEKQKLINADLVIAKKSAEQLQDESTEEIEKDIENIELTNAKVRSNLDKEKAILESKTIKEEYDELTDKIEAIRDSKLKLLESANLTLQGLTIEDSELVYNGQKWDCMSSSEQLITATAIIKNLNPECGFVLLDKLEQMDRDTLDSFSEWLKKENLQVIATRVSTGEECSIIIEDGQVLETEKPNFIPNKF